MKKRLYLLSALTGVILLICFFSGCYAGPGGDPAATGSSAPAVKATYTWTNATAGDSGVLRFYSDDTWYKTGIVGGYKEDCKGTYSGDPAVDGSLTMVRTHRDTGHGWYEAGVTYSVTVSGGSFTDQGCVWSR